MDELLTSDATHAGQNVSLAEAFRTFNVKTEILQDAHETLGRKIDTLNANLEEKNEELHVNLLEVDKAKNYLYSILESMSSGVLAVNPRGEITLFNRAASEVTGYEGIEALGVPYWQVFGQGASLEDTPLYTVATGKTLVNRGKYLPLRDGTHIPVEFSTSLITDEEGTITGAVEIFRDISEVKRLQEEARQSHTLAVLGETVAVIAHEIGNPLAGIAGYAELLERDLEEGDPRKVLAMRVVEGVGTLNKVIKNILLFARPMKVHEFQEVDINETIDSALSFLQAQLKGQTADIRISKAVTQQRTVCKLDSGLLQMVFLNLFKNAIEAMPEGGELKVEVQIESSHAENPYGATHTAVVKISDTGSGVSPEIRDSIFDPFFTTKEDGTGLGLATVKRVMQVINGTVEVGSTPGERTIFTLTLPISQE